jgi:hypothetical protein
MGRTSCPCHQNPKTTTRRFLGISRHAIGGSVRGQNMQFVGNAKKLQNFGRFVHNLQIRGTSHNNGYFGG